MDFASRVQALKQANYSTTVHLCMQYVQEHLYERIRVEEAAASVQRNPSYLTQRFRQETGMSVTQYIQQQKIEEAKRLLQTPGSGSIWLQLGYCDQSHFDRAFKKAVGMTPGASGRNTYGQIRKSKRIHCKVLAAHPFDSLLNG